MSWN
jgi:hypothetical protein